MQDWSQLIESKSHASGEPLMQWLAVLGQVEALVEIGALSEVDLGTVMNAANSAHALANWVALLHQHAAEFPGESSGFQLFMECVERFPFSLDMWLDAVGYFCDWMYARESTVTLEEALGYVQQCATQALQEMPHRSLYRSVLEALDMYGVEEL